MLPRLFLVGDGAHTHGLPFQLTKQLLHDPAKDILWIPRSQWHTVNHLAEEQRTAKVKVTVALIPEGGLYIDALLGACSLGLDVSCNLISHVNFYLCVTIKIVKNETEHSISFDHIFVDAGTGMIAISLLLALSCIWLHIFSLPCSIYSQKMPVACGPNGRK